MSDTRVNLHEFKLLSLTVMLAICGSIGIDIHLASLPHIMHFMHTNKQHMQQSVTLFVFGVGLSILIYGPLSDKVGRKPVVIFGLLLASITSFLASTATHIGIFLLLRFLQGFGSGVCWGLGRIIVADVMQGEKLAALGSYFSMFTSLSPLLAPALGAYVQSLYGWQANFILLGLVILFVLILFLFFFDETNHHKRADAFVLPTLLATYGSLLKHRLFVGCALLTGVFMSASILYNTTASFIFQQDFKTSAVVFGWLMAVAGAVSFVGKFIAPLILKRIKQFKMLQLGITLLLVSGMYLFILQVTHWMNIPIFLVGVSVAVLSFVFTGGTIMSMALSPFHDRRGSAGALYGASQLLISFALSALFSSMPHPGVMILAVGYIAFGLLGVACFYKLIR